MPLFWPLLTSSIRLPPRIATATWQEVLLLTLILAGLLGYALTGPATWTGWPYRSPCPVQGQAAEPLVFR